MIHYSCDRCKCVLNPQEDLRYVVHLEARAVMDGGEFGDDDDDRDHLLEVHEILERSDDLQDEMVGSDVYQRQRFDLCGDCFRKFIKNPVGLEWPKQLDFSQN